MAHQPKGSLSAIYKLNQLEFGSVRSCGGVLGGGGGTRELGEKLLEEGAELTTNSTQL